MAKDSLNPYDIYEKMREMFPGEYLPLRKIKPRLPARGEKPKRPERMLRDHQELGPDSTFQDIGRLFAEIPVNNFRVTVQREQIGQEEYEDGDWTWDETSGDETYETWTATRPKYGERIVKINIYADYERPDWRYIDQAWKEEVRSWEQAGSSRKKRDEEIKEARSYNRQLMDDARKSNHERWVMVARHLKGIRSPKYLLKQKARLEQQLADIDRMLGEDDA